jgi:hypothetical protein
VWSWDHIHLDSTTLGDRATLDSFVGWLNKRVSALSRQKTLNKNQLQGLLLGIGILIRDIEISQFSDSGTIPNGIVDCCLLPEDVNPLFNVMKALSAAVTRGLRYVCL